MNVPFFDLQRQSIGIRRDIERAVLATMHSGAFVNGSEVAHFERIFAAYIGTRFGIACANGTDALELALEVLGVGPGDEVIVPAHTWISTASAACRLGAKPVFAHCSPDYYTIDVEDARARITPATKALIGVHLYGHPAQAEALRALADEAGIAFVEDCAQAHGAAIGTKKVGSFGHLATFSFYPSKNLGAFGDGGFITTDNGKYDEDIRILQQCGQVSKNKHLVPGRNSRLDAIQAAILTVKLPILDTWNKQRIQAAALYDERLAGLPVVVPAVRHEFRHVYHVYAIRTKQKHDLKAFLTQSGIATGEHYPNILPDLPFFDEGGDYAQSRYVHELISLPMFPGITSDEVEGVVKCIADFFH